MNYSACGDEVASNHCSYSRSPFEGVRVDANPGTRENFDAHATHRLFYSRWASQTDTYPPHYDEARSIEHSGSREDEVPPSQARIVLLAAMGC